MTNKKYDKNITAKIKTFFTELLLAVDHYNPLHNSILYPARAFLLFIFFFNVLFFLKVLYQVIKTNHKTNYRSYGNIQRRCVIMNIKFITAEHKNENNDRQFQPD